jgi:hypothetical protein
MRPIASARWRCSRAPSEMVRKRTLPDGRPARDDFFRRAPEHFRVVIQCTNPARALPSVPARRATPRPVRLTLRQKIRTCRDRLPPWPRKERICPSSSTAICAGTSSGSVRSRSSRDSASAVTCSSSRSRSTSTTSRRRGSTFRCRFRGSIAPFRHSPARCGARTTSRSRSCASSCDDRPPSTVCWRGSSTGPCSGSTPRCRRRR